MIIVCLALLIGHMAIASATLSFGESPSAARSRGRVWVARGFDPS